MVLIHKYQKIGKYHSRSWKYERSTKYVFSKDNLLIEAGYYTHFNEKGMTNAIKHVIELSTSYGCPFHCKYCASSMVTNISLLSSDDVFSVFSYIYNDNRLSNIEKTEVSFMGIGDIYYTFNTVTATIPRIIALNDKIKFNVSSCYWTKKHIEELKQFSDYLKTIQITFISSEESVVRSVIPGFPLEFYNIKDVLYHFNKIGLKYIRINYVMIKDINDSDADFHRFIDNVREYRENVVVRISRMNTTNASSRNGLFSPSITDMIYFDDLLKRTSIESYLFYSFQDDAMNCGQLITECKL